MSQTTLNKSLQHPAAFADTAYFCSEAPVELLIN